MHAPRFPARVRGPALALALVASFAWFAGSRQGAQAGGREETLRYATSYAAAVQEAKQRNAVLFATFHKDK